MENVRYDPEALMSSSRFGSNLVTMKAQVQLKQKATGEAIGLASGENSSAFITQGRGPKPGC